MAQSKATTATRKLATSRLIRRTLPAAPSPDSHTAPVGSIPVKILVSEPRTSRTSLEKLIHEVADELGLEIELRQPDAQEVAIARRAWFKQQTDGWEQRSGEPLNTILPELFEIVLKAGGATVAASAAIGSVAKAGQEVLTFYDAIADRIRKRNLGKVEPP